VIVTGVLGGVLATAALWVGRSLRRPVEPPAAPRGIVLSYGPSRDRGAEAAVGLAFLIALGILSAQKSSARAEPDRAILALFPEEPDADPKAGAKKVVLLLHDYERLRALAKVRQAKDIPLLGGVGHASRCELLRRGTSKCREPCLPLDQ